MSLTPAEVDARIEESLRHANDALAATRGLPVRWWGYSCSHHTFDMIVGDPTGETDNVALCCPSTHSICGPIEWREQNLRVEVVIDRTAEVWSQYTLVDEQAGFRLRAGAFYWRRKYDLLSNRSIWFATQATHEHVEYLCPTCRHASYGYYPYCAACGRELPAAAMMQGVGLARPVTGLAGLLELGLKTLRNSSAAGAP